MKNTFLQRFSLLLCVFAGIVCVSLASCKKMIEIPLPNNQLPADFVFNNDNTGIQAITGIYSEMMSNSIQFSCGQTTFYTGLSADELYNYSPGVTDEFASNQLSAAAHSALESIFWNPCYKYIYAANKCIEGATGSNTLSTQAREMILGEAKFIRAFCFFYLVNLFGDVPLITNSDYRFSQSMARTDKSEVYLQIVEDLKAAKVLLLSSYPTVDRTRPNKWTATALLARVYLTLRDWANAESESNAVIGSGLYNLNNNLNNVFLINSNETIWQLRPVATSRNTWEGYYTIPGTGSSTPTYLLTDKLLSAFELNDQRKTSWVKSYVFAGQTVYYPYKYKVFTSSTLTEDYVVFRLSEQYLIRSEARAQLNNIVGSQSDLNLIRARAGLAPIIASNQSTLVDAIAQERRVELFAEWGHRWFDLKRTNRATAVLSVLKVNWQPTDELWPIPQSQINLNPSLTQNAGY